MNYRFGWYALAVALTALACAPKVASPATTTASVSEDLSTYRPRYRPLAPVTVSKKLEPVPEKRPAASPQTSDQPMHITRRLDLVLDTLAVRNRGVKHVPGFRIQMYVGTSRQEADAAKIYAYQTFPELNVYMSFSAPTYRLRVGDFLNRMDVERYHNALKDQYPSALILTDKVEIRKSMLVK